MAAEPMVTSYGYKPLTASLILHDEGDKMERKEYIDGFKKLMDVDVLIVNKMLLTGFDAPRLKKLYLGNGYDSFTMFNVYPQRATDPNAMDTTFNRALHEQNMAAFRYVLGQYAPGNRPAVWAAWGTLIEKRPYLFDALEEMLAIGEEYHAQWLTFGPRSKAGHPHHPLYLRRDSVPEPFDVRAYCAAQRARLK